MLTTDSVARGAMMTTITPSQRRTAASVWSKGAKEQVEPKIKSKEGELVIRLLYEINVEDTIVHNVMMTPVLHSAYKYY